MKELGYHKGYQYAHDHPDAVISQGHLPEQLTGREFYRPKESGFEKTIRERLAWWAAKRQEQVGD